MKPNDYKIILRDVSKQFFTSSGPLHALVAISLAIQEGEFFSIVGPSGCGKSTLIRILANLENASSGTITINTNDQGRPVNSMVFQEQSIFPWMNVRDNVSYGLRMRNIPSKQCK